MTNTIDTAAREYANRPKDERFPSIQALCDAALAEKNLSAERTYNLKDLQIVPAVTAAGETLRLQSPKGTARFTPWSFGQLCRTLGAPASYLRELPPAIAADAVVGQFGGGR